MSRAPSMLASGPFLSPGGMRPSIAIRPSNLCRPLPMAHPSQPGHGAASGDNVASNSTPSLASSTSATSRMAKFYTPMNPTFMPPTSAASLPPPPPTSSSTSAGILKIQPGTSEPSAPPSTTQTLSPNALAQLALIPGFISDSAIQAARQEYDAAQRQQRGSGASEHEIQSAHLPLYSKDTSLENMSSNPTSSITDLLRQLRETETTSSIVAPVAPSTSWPSAYSSSQAPQPLSYESEDYSNGKVTPQLLKRLADLAEKDTREGRPLFSEIKRLRERQLQVELSFFQERSNLIGKQKQQLVQLQASEIMGVDVTKQTRLVKTAHRDELSRFDQGVVQAMDSEILHVQDSLAFFGVPMMARSQDPGMIASQIRVLRLLEDMVQG